MVGLETVFGCEILQCHEGDLLRRLKKEAEIQLLLNGNKRNMILALAHRELLHDEANAYVKNFHKESI